MDKNKETQSSNKGVDNMDAVIMLDKYKEQRDLRISSYSILDLIRDPKKKQESDKYYRENYEYFEEDDFAKKMYGKTNKDKD